MRILLTGATGFIGAHVARALLARGVEVHGMTLPGAPRDRLAEVASQMELREGDLSDAAWVRDTVRSIAPEAAIHLAWYAEPRSYLRAVPENLASLRGGINLLEALAEGGTCRRVVLAGTCLENLDTPGPTVYAAAKAAQHRLALGFTDRSMTAACAHIHYLYGPWEDERRVVPTVTRSLLHRERIDLTDGMQSRDYLHVADVADALCRVAESDLSGPRGHLHRHAGKASGRLRGDRPGNRRGGAAPDRRPGGVRVDGVAGHGRSGSAADHGLAAALRPAARDRRNHRLVGHPREDRPVKEMKTPASPTG